MKLTKSERQGHRCLRRHFPEWRAENCAKLGAEREGVPFIIWFVNPVVGYDYGTYGMQKPDGEITAVILPDGSKFIQEKKST